MRIDPLVDDAATSDAVTEVVMEIPPLADGAAISDALTEGITEMEPIAEGSSLNSGLLTLVTEASMESSGPATNSQVTPRHDNNAALIDNYISDDSDYKNDNLYPILSTRILIVKNNQWELREEKGVRLTKQHGMNTKTNLIGKRGGSILLYRNGKKHKKISECLNLDANVRQMTKVL